MIFSMRKGIGTASAIPIVVTLGRPIMACCAHHNIWECFMSESFGADAEEQTVVQSEPHKSTTAVAGWDGRRYKASR